MGAPSLIAGPTKWIGTTRRRRVPANEQGQERQHFLLTSAACDLSEAKVARMTEEEAYAVFEAIRFLETDGVPYCPYCGTADAYRLLINRRTKAGVVPTKLYRCREYKVCRKQFSVTSGTTFASRKMPIRDILYGLMVFADGASGVAALRMRRAIGCSYKAAYVFEGKIREAMAKSRDPRLFEGIVEVDGTVIGGHDRKARLKDKGKETRIGAPSKELAVVALRERRPDGESRVAVFDHESRYRDGTGKRDFIRDNVRYGTNMISDEGFELGYIGPHDKVKHKDGYQIDGIHSNGVESLFARLKRAENGVHYRMTGDYLDLYAQEASWREDYRRRSNGEQWRMLIHATTHAPTSKRWAGYWQRWQADDPSITRRRKAA